MLQTIHPPALLGIASICQTQLMGSETKIKKIIGF